MLATRLVRGAPSAGSDFRERETESGDDFWSVVWDEADLPHGYCYPGRLLTLQSEREFISGRLSAFASQQLQGSHEPLHVHTSAQGDPGGTPRARSPCGEPLRGPSARGDPGGTSRARSPSGEPLPVPLSDQEPAVATATETLSQPPTAPAGVLTSHRGSRANNGVSSATTASEWDSRTAFRCTRHPLTTTT